MAAKDFRLMQRLNRGIVTDKLGVPGALLEAHDVMPLDRGEGFRTRGGKALRTPAVDTGMLAWPSSNSVYGHSMWSLVGTQIKPELAGITYSALLHFTYDLAPALNGWAVMSSDADMMRLPTQAFDETGTAIAFPGRTNQFTTLSGSGVVFGGELLIPSTSLWGGIGMRYAGGVENSTVTPYSTGTVSGAAGQSILTGAGTTFASGYHDGCFIHVNDADMEQRAYRIVRVISPTSIEVDRPLGGAVAASTAYRISSNAAWSCKPGTFGAYQHSSVVTANSAVDAAGAEVHQGRVFVWDTVDADNRSYPERIRWSAVLNETDGHWGGAELFDPNGFLDVAPGDGIGGTASTGARSDGVLWCTSFRGVLYIFKRTAIYALRGYVATDGSDEGASIDLVARVDGLVNDRTKPVVGADGIYFGTSRGLMVVSESSIRNITVDTGTLALWTNDGSGAHPSMIVSVLRDRIIVQPDLGLTGPGDTHAGTRTLVFDRRLGIWTTQYTLSTTNVLELADGVEVAFLRVSKETQPGWAVRWDEDYDYGELRGEGQWYPLMQLTTHVVSLASPDSANGRLRAAQVKAKVVDTDFTDVVLDVSVLLGEEGTTTAVEAAIGATTDVVENTATEKWNRVPVRGGTPPVDAARVRLVQVGGSTDVRVTEVGVEHVPVRRLR